MKHLIVLIGILITNMVNAQDNCQAFMHYGDTLQYEACMIIKEVDVHYYQFSKEYHEIMDRAIAKCPYYATAYHGKSVAYLKSGDFVTWKSLIDKAVQLKPEEYLSNRAWCRYQFFGDHQGAIDDIERLDSLVSYDIGYVTNGDYHLNMAKAICYKAIGDREKAIEIIENHINTKGYSIGLYDYLHLGVLYLEDGQYQKAIDTFKIQESENNMAENQFYLALAHKNLNQLSEYEAHLRLSKKLYEQGRKLNDPYTHHADKIYKKQIDSELKELELILSQG